MSKISFELNMFSKEKNYPSQDDNVQVEFYQTCVYIISKFFYYQFRYFVVKDPQ